MNLTLDTRVIASRIDRIIYEVNEWTLRSILIEALKGRTAYTNLGPDEKWELGWDLDDNEKLHVTLTQSREQVENVSDEEASAGE